VTQVAAAGKFTVPLTDTAYAALSASNQQLLNAGLQNYDCSQVQDEPDVAAKYFIACADGSSVGGTPGAAYAVLLGPVIVAGKQIDSASAVAPNIANGGSATWTVGLTLKGSGNSKWAKYTGAHNIGSTSITGASPSTCGATATPCADFVGFTLDGIVVSIPVNESTINGGTTQISGGFTASSAKDLANKLKYGALPLTFKAQQAEVVSATLGSSQLKAGLLAGGIGLVLVVLYSLIYYRALGLVTIASLLVSGGLTYGALVMLATQIDFTLSLAGIAGFIVAVGITADSFVVFFERMKDEVHEGRSARVAIPRAWVRARRTILSADTVSFLAAAILYYFAAGDVKGFAFTLGLSTILDLVVVFLFTHPLVSWLSRFQNFGSARFTGLDAIRGGPAVSDVPPPSAARVVGRGARTPNRARDEAPVAVLDADADADDAADVDDVDAPDAPTTSDTVDDGQERRHTAPEPGSAAERAAARRARMRDQGNTGNADDTEKGES
jgi:preprotein translocase subunit SecD